MWYTCIYHGGHVALQNHVLNVSYGTFPMIVSVIRVSDVKSVAKYFIISIERCTICYKISSDRKGMGFNRSLFAETMFITSHDLYHRPKFLNADDSNIEHEPM